jgi:DNA polymerase-4
MKHRIILHIDLDAFFCAVEALLTPSLVGKPFAVGGKAQERGVVSSCSYEARKYGVRSAMPMARAQRLCPNLFVISPHYSEYRDMSENVMEILSDLTPLVEQISIDEAFLDVSDIVEPAESIARNLQKKVWDDLNLPSSIGVASNKLVAKIANDFGKSAHTGEGPPNAITVVEPGREAEFLQDLPVQALWGVGPKTADRLDELGITKIGDLALQEIDVMKSIFGKIGFDLVQRARGIDNRPIQTSHEIKSVSQETTFSRDISNKQQLRETFLRLSQGVGKRLRRNDISGSTVRIKVRWPDFKTISRQITLEQRTNQDYQIFETAWNLFSKVWKPGRKVRLLGVGLSGLGPPIRQLTFWDKDVLAKSRLQSVIDEVNDRLGEDSLQRGIHEGK